MSPWRSRALLSVALAAATVAAYAGVWNHGFLSYDDELYVAGNSALGAGLSGEGLRWALTTGLGANWFPLTWLSLLLDYELFGPEPAGYHATNLALHTASTVLLFLVLAGMTRAAGPSAFVAGVFALHPLHVESVAWVSERKDVLSGLFWILTLAAHARYAARPSLGRYAPVFGCLALGLMAKPMLVTLPFVLLLLDDWPLGRLRDASGRVDRARLRSLVVEKLPLFALVAASSVVTVIVQRAGGAVQALDRLPFDQRLANAPVAYLRYLGKSFLPTDLAVIYPHPGASLPLWQPLAAAAALLGISAAALLAWRRRPYLAVGWLWFLGTLVPVIGLVQVGNQALADRYTYLPLVGLSIAVAWGARDLLGRALPRTATALGGAATLAVLGLLTSIQVGHWRDTETLFTHAIAVTEDNHLAHTILANELIEQGRVREAVPHLSEAIRIAPDHAPAHVLLGEARLAEGRPAAAEESYRRALELHPDPRTRIALGSALLFQKRPAAAVEAYRAGLRRMPDSVVGHARLGLALEALGRVAEARASYRRALELDPNQPDVRQRLAHLPADGEAQEP